MRAPPVDEVDHPVLGEFAAELSPLGAGHAKRRNPCATLVRALLPDREVDHPVPGVFPAELPLLGPGDAQGRDLGAAPLCALGALEVDHAVTGMPGAELATFFVPSAPKLGPLPQSGCCAPLVLQPGSAHFCTPLRPTIPTLACPLHTYKIPRFLLPASNIYAKPRRVCVGACAM